MKRLSLIMGIISLFLFVTVGVVSMPTNANAKDTAMPPSCNAAVQILPGDGDGDGPPLDYQDNSDGTFTDCNTKDMWEKKVSGSGGSCLDNDKLHSVDATCNWNQATGAWIDKFNDTCEGEGVDACVSDKDCPAGERCGYAGYSDWCIPNAKRLQSIVDYSVTPSINPSVPGATRDSFYWSSTTFKSNTNFAWDVSFFVGTVNVGNKLSNLFARAVRPCS